MRGYPARSCTTRERLQAAWVGSRSDATALAREALAEEKKKVEVKAEADVTVGKPDKPDEEPEPDEPEPTGAPNESAPAE